MTWATIFGYQFGNAAAIRAVAQNRGALGVGAFLVLLTAIARNYDQSPFLATRFWLVGPLLFSLFSGLFLFSVLWLFLRRRFEARPRFWPEWLRFQALFWMTAPVAWIYAIPVERFLDSLDAARANLTLLGIVSAWRVILMARVVSVTSQIPMRWAVLWVLLPAALEVVAVVFLGGIFSPSFGKRVMSGMAGMRNSPEEALMFDAMMIVFKTAVAVTVALGIVCGLNSPEIKAAALPKPTERRVPLLALTLLAVAWVAIAIPSQRAESRFLDHSQLVLDGKYRESIDFLARHQPSDFPPHRRLEPNPYEYRVIDHLHKVVAEVKPDAPAWIREMYLSHATVFLSHPWHQGLDARKVRDLLKAIAKLPGEKEWFAANAENIRRALELSYRERDDADEKEHDAAQDEIAALLKERGLKTEDL